MNKEQLISLKNRLEYGKKQKYYAIMMKNGAISEEADVYEEKLNSILSKRGTKDAVNALTNNFETLIRLFNQYNYDYDEFSFFPKFYLLVNEADYDEEIGELRKNPKFLEDNVYIKFSDFSIKKEGKKVQTIELSEELEIIFSELFYVSFVALKVELASEGLELEGINKFEDLKNNCVGKITIKFTKEKEIAL